MSVGKSSAQEENITAAGEAFHLLFDGHPAPLAIYDFETLQILRVNQAAVEQYGYAREEFQSLTLGDILPEAEAARLLENLQQRSPSLRRMGEWKNCVKGGGIIVVEVTSHALQFGGRKAVLVMARDVTERKRAEEALLKLKKAVDTSSEAIFMTDTNGVFTYVNPGFTALYGHSPEEVIGKTTPRILKSGLLSAEVYLQFWKRLAGGQEVKGEIINKRKNGKLLDIESSSSPIIDDAGHIIGYLGIQRDVGPRKRAEEELRWAVERYQNLFQESPMMDIVTHNQGGIPIITECNQAFLNTLGYTREEALGRPLADFYTPESRAELLQNEGYLRALSGGFTSESRAFVARDGRVIDTILAAAPETDARGKVIGTRGMYIDVTERKKAEALKEAALEALRIAEAKYHAIFEYAPVGIYQSTPQGRFISVNPMMARIFGYTSPDDMLNHIVSIDVQYYVNPADRREFQNLMADNAEAHEMCTLNYRKDGSQIWIQENARAVKDAQGNILYYEGFVTDVTDQKRAEDNLRQAKESLELANRELARVLEREQHLARTDGLTGLYNYRYFFELAAHEFNIAMRYRQPLSVLMFDADSFKQINDTYGHLVGDALLLKVAEVVAAQMRASDVLARYGGDEFVILLSHTNAQQAYIIAERIRLSVADLQLPLEHTTLSVTLSIGVAEMLPGSDNESVERIIQRADKALYAAKQAGRNCTVIL